MLSLNFRNPAEAALPLTSAAAQTVAIASGSDVEAPPTTLDEMRESVKVILSQNTLRQAKQTNKNADIDASHLPDRIKEQLKLIRALQAKIAEKMQQMQAFMNDRSLSPKTRDAKIRQLQMETMAMTNSLIQATNGLNQSMQQMKLSLADRTLAATLVSPQNLDQ